MLLRPNPNLLFPVRAHISRLCSARFTPSCHYASRLTPRITNSLSVPRRRFSSTETDDEVVDFGNYSIILPLETPIKHAFDDVPAGIIKPFYAQVGEGVKRPPTKKSSRIDIGSLEERKMRESCRLAKETLEYAGTLVREGITTAEIDSLVRNFIVSHGAYPSPLRYEGFPKSICTSVNNIVSHGIPDSRMLENGDTINIDITVYYNGYHGDTSRTFAVGDVDAKGIHLLQTAQTALDVGISTCHSGRHYRDIGAAIHAYIHGRPIPIPKTSASSPTIGYSPSRSPIRRPQIEGVIYEICTAFSGHGIGQEFHTRPWIYHDKNEEPGKMEVGDCFTIEPIILQSSPSEPTDVFIWPDDWTVSTANGARGAVFEHTVMITENGVDILT